MLFRSGRQVYRQADQANANFYGGGGVGVLGNPVIGTIRGYLSLTSQLAQKTGCSILLIDYSLAPELKFPHGINDCKKAFSLERRVGIMIVMIILVMDVLMM